MGARSYGDKLFYKIFQYSINKQTLKANMNFQLYYYDYTDGENKKVSDMNICDFCVDADNGMLYYFVVGKDCILSRLTDRIINSYTRRPKIWYLR